MRRSPNGVPCSVCKSLFPYFRSTTKRKRLLDHARVIPIFTSQRRQMSIVGGRLPAVMEYWRPIDRFVEIRRVRALPAGELPGVRPDYDAGALAVA